ncbi:MAG TPA: hypothetical protein ENL01_04770, partial [Chlorobaculum parvum]|nr:hypothetical protein [Chlorobaculum parvum]
RAEDIRTILKEVSGSERDDDWLPFFPICENCGKILTTKAHGFDKEFMRWYRLTYELTPLLKYFEEKDTAIPTLYLMGEEDHMFLPAVRIIVASHTNSTLEVISNSGHVCNVDQPAEFNARAIAFLKALGNKSCKSARKAEPSKPSLELAAC